jgi:hypothetical protein
MCGSCVLKYFETYTGYFPITSTTACKPLVWFILVYMLSMCNVVSKQL